MVSEQPTITHAQRAMYESAPWVSIKFCIIVMLPFPLRGLTTMSSASSPGMPIAFKTGVKNSLSFAESPLTLNNSIAINTAQIKGKMDRTSFTASLAPSLKVSYSGTFFNNPITNIDMNNIGNM